MLSFEEFKKRKTQSTQSASEGQQKQSTGSNKVLSFEEWKAQRNNQTQEPEQKTSLFDSSKIDRYIRDANNFLETSNKELQGMTYQNAGSQYTSKLKQSEDLKNRGFEISQYLNQYRNELDDKYVNSVKNAIKEFDGASKQAMAKFLDIKQAYSLWESEDDYNAYLAQLQDDEEKSRYDIDAGQKEIEALEAQLKQLSQPESSANFVNGMPYAIGQQAVYSEEYAPAANNVNGMPYAAYQQAMYAPVDKQAAELRDEILRKKQYLNQAKQIQRKIAFESAAGNKDFAQHSVYVSGVDDVLYNWINDKQFRSQYSKSESDVWNTLNSAPNPNAQKSKYERKNYDKLTDEEVKLYNYYYATQGAEKAQEYLDVIQEELNRRAGEQIAGEFKDQTAAEIFYGAAAGLSQFGSGVKGAVSMIAGKDDYLPQSKQQFAGQYMREDLADSGAKLPEWMGGGSLAQGAYDLVSTTANMAPSILASTAIGLLNPAAGAAVGSGLMGTSAAGNAYQTALNSGYDKNAARAYGVSIGVAETAMQRLLGGISSLGGVSPAVTKAVEGIDNGLLRFFAKWGASMASEGLEEGLQEVLDPILQNAILGADENVDWANVVYSALLGAASAGVLEIGGKIREARQEAAAKAEYGNKTDELITEGLSYDAGTEANEIAQQYKARVDSGKSMTGAQIKHQLEANNVAKVETAAKERLVELGETDDPAEIAKLATKRAMGEALKPAEKSRLARSKFGAQVAKELVPENAAKGKLVDAMTRPGKYKPLDTRVETDVSGRVSESGKNELADSGAEFDLKQIDAKTDNDGKLVWTVDGQETTTDNIKFKDEDTAHIFQAVEQIENISATAAPVLVRSVDTSKNIIKQLNGLDEAYTYGFYNYSIEDLKAGEFVAGLTETQMMDAYRLGEAARARTTENVDASKVNLRTAEQKAEQVKKRMITDDTEVYFADGSEVVKFDQHKHKYDDKRMAGVNAAKFLSKMGIGGKFYFYESYMKNGVRVYKNESGKEVPAPNGIFKAVDGSIYIDMNAGNKGEGTTLFTMGHELTHFVKANSEKQFKRLADLVKEAYDNTDLSLHQRVINKQETLSKIRNEHVSYDEAYEEVVADAMSTMMTDGSLYEKLAELRSTDKGLFNTIKRFFDEMIAKFKKVYESLAPDQQDAQDIRELKDMFDSIQTAFAEALVEASDNFSAEKNTTDDGGVKHQARNKESFTAAETQAIQNIGRKSIFAFTSADIEATERLAMRYWKEMGVKSPFFRAWFGDWRVNDQSLVKTAGTKGDARGVQKNEDTGWDIQVSGQVFNETKTHRSIANKEARPYLPYINDIVKNAVLLDTWGFDQNDVKSENSLLMHSLYAVADIGNGQEILKLYVEEMNDPSKADSSKRAYQLQNIEKAFNASVRVQGNAPSSLTNTKNAINTVADLFAYVKQMDKNFNPNASSKIVDAEGKPKVLYHGSTAQFEAFDKKKAKSSGTYGKGFYFTDSDSHAGTYGNLYEVYLNIQNPVQAGKSSVTKIQVKAFLEAVADNEDYSIENYGTYDVDAVLKNVIGVKSKADAFRVLQDISVTAIGDMVEAVKLFNDVNGTNYDGIVAATETVAFEPTQIKSATDNIGTFDKSNPKFKYSTRNTEASKNPVDYGSIMDMQTEVARLTREIAEFEETEEFKTKMKEIFGSSDIEKAIKDYQEWRKSSGYEGMIEKRDALKAELENARKQFDDYNAEQAANKQKNAIEKSGLSEAEYFRKQAVKEFGYTPYFYDAGYLTPNGKMLNFSGENGKHFGSRGQDHRAIGVIYEDTQGSAAMTRFMNDGNIRIMAETPGLDISSSVEPTKDQYASIKKFAREFGSKEKYFAVDISDNNGRVIGNYEYDGNVNADRVVNDIKYFFENGKVREQSSVARFHNSDRTPDSISNRHLLANAFEGISRNSVEYGMIQDYKQNIDKLNKLEEQLSDVNAEIRQLRFGKDVERDPDRLRELEDKAESLANEINKYDKRLINMEASEPLRKVLDRERKKVRQKTIEHTKQIQQNRKLRKEQTELRKRIRRTIMDLDKIMNKGDKKRNVKDGLRAFVDQAIKATDVLFMDDVKPYDMLRAGFTATMTESEKAQVEEARKMLDELDEIYGQSNEQNPAKDPEFVAAEARLDAKIAEMSDIFERENMAREETTVSGVISKIMIEYKKIEESPQIEVRNAYSDAVYEHMGQLAKVIGDTRIKDMSVDQLQKLYEMYSWVKATVSMANKFFAENIKQNVSEMAAQSVTEFKRSEAQRKKDKRIEAVYAVLDKIGWSNEKVTYALRRLNNSVITTLMQNIIDGEDVTMRDVQDAIKFRKDIEKKYNYKQWDFDKTYTFEDKHGEQFEMQLEHLLSFYAYSRREAARSHITKGGITIKTNSLLKKESVEAHAISEDGIAKMESALTEEQRAYVREMQSYLSDVMGAKGNEVSLKLYGIKMFNEESYFPIQSTEEYLAKVGEADLKVKMGITNMASAGFTKSVVQEAATPIKVGGFLDVWANHVNEMSRYHGFVLPMEDFRRVFNFSSYATDERSTAVRASMENAFGKDAVKYFDDLYRDLNAGASTDRTNEKIARKWFSRFKKNAVMYSLSVVVQQPTAIVRAGAMIDRKYFGIFGSTGRIATGLVRLFSKNHTKLWNEMLEYAPGVTTIKEIGGFDTATGGSILSALKEETYENAAEHWNAFKKNPIEWTSKFADDNFLSRIPAYADQIAWVEIWNAVKRETLANNKGVVANTKEHLELSGKRFSEVIRMTQVYDSVFAKSPLMRSQSLAVQMVTSFMAEPNTTINMVEDGLREMTRGNKRSGARFLWTAAAAITFNNLVKSVVYAMRDDDEDQNFKEKYLESVIGGMLNDVNFLNYIPIARDVWSVAQGYDVERADMTLISDLADNLTRVSKLSRKDTSEMDEDQLAAHEKAQLAAYMALVDSIGALTGFPIKNIRRDVKAFVNTFFGNKAGESTKLSIAYTVEKALNEATPTMLRPETTPKTDVLYDTIMAGDATYLNRLKNGYKDEKAYTTAVRKALRENDPRIAEAAQALYENNAAEYKRLYQQIRSENKFTAEDILSAIDSETAALKKETEGGSESAPYSASDFVKATVVGDSAAAKAMLNEYIAFMASSGMSRDDAVKKFQQSVYNSVSDSFHNGMLTRNTAKKLLVDHAGKSTDEAEDRITYWEFTKKYPQYDLSESAVLDYYDIAEPLGISINNYAKFAKAKGGKRDEILTAIDSLDLSNDQKDALYLMTNLAESKIWDTPWH